METDKVQLNQKLYTDKSTEESKEYAAIYIRVSSKRQKNERYSEENQLGKAQKYAEDNKWEYTVFKEERPASRGYDEEILTDDIIENFNNRPVLQNLMREAERGRFKHLILLCRDRLARNLHEALAIQFFFKRHGVDIHYTNQGLNVQSDNTYIESFIDIILNAISEYEASLLSERVKEGNKGCIQKGWWAGGRTPIGYIRKCVEKKKDGSALHSTLVKSNFESFYVTYIFELYKKGYSFKQIAELLNKEHGFRRWTKSKISGIISNQTYTGKIYYQRRGGRRKGYKKYDEPIASPVINEAEIINQDSWQECREVRKTRSETKDAYRYLTPFILKDKLYCTDCGDMMKPKNPGKNKSNVYKCKCSNEDAMHNNSIPARKVHHLFSKTVQKEFENRNYDFLWDKYDEEFNNKKLEYERFLEEIADKIKEEKDLIDKIDEQIKIEKNKFVIYALENQHKISTKILEEYRKIQDEWIKRQPARVERDKFNEVIYKALVGVLDKCDIEDTELDEETQKIHIYKVREFVINFIDSVHIEFENRTIKSMELQYKIGKFL